MYVAFLLIYYSILEMKQRDPKACTEVENLMKNCSSKHVSFRHVR